MRYNKSFHQKRVGHPRYPILASASLTAHSTAFSGDVPNDVVDVGCSVGALLNAINDIKPCTLYGVDYSLDKQDTVFNGLYSKFDLNVDNAAYTGIRGDLVICQEVLEHVEPENTDNAILAIQQFSNPRHSTLVFGAAHPGQPGRHHVNCKTKEEWRQLLVASGWEYSQEATNAYLTVLKDNNIKRGCYIDNTMCFFRK